ncbi:MAG: FAD-dependent oxidoreductase [Candidatus Aminicenantaceae bacterium]
MVNFLILGADAAGLSAAVQIKRRLPDSEVRVISRGRIISYGACGIPYVISGDIASPQKLVHNTPESFEKTRGIPVRVRHEATGIVPKEHSVMIRDLDSGESYREAYGKLLIGTGAQPVRLPFIDYALEGVFNLHTVEDLERVLLFLEEKKPRRAAIIGAGNVGLELAEALCRRGLRVQMFDNMPEPAFLWPPMIRKAVTAKIREKEIEFFGGTAIRSLERRNGRLVLTAEEGAAYEADVVFSVVGTAPATGFCRDTLNTKKNGAIFTDRRGRTSDPDIYAAGDCASVYHRLLDRNVYFPLGSTANKMGRIAGMNMSGGDIEFPGIVGTQILKFFELSLSKTGLSQPEAEKEGFRVRSYSAARLDKADYYPGAQQARVEVVCEDDSGVLLGAAAVSETNAAQFIDAAAVAVFAGMDIQDLGWFDSAYAPPFAPVWNALISAALKASKA